MPSGGRLLKTVPLGKKRSGLPKMWITAGASCLHIEGWAYYPSARVSCTRVAPDWNAQSASVKTRTFLVISP
jgi:hypothetical protein